jgi:N-acetylglucosaminyldiphosphoundecaprenol N-acetyl-beta-D-mannosaminyltransferase
MVTIRSMFDSSLGLLCGLLAFVPVHFFYLWLAERRAKGSPRFNVIGVGVDAVCMTDCLKLFEEIISGKSSMQKSEDRCQVSDELISDLRSPTSGCHNGKAVMTSALGVAGIVEARRNQKLQRILNESVLNTPDGMPLVWLGKLFGYRNIERVYGPDLLRDVCAYSASRGWRHFFYGAAPGIVEKLKEKLELKYPGIQIVGTVCPPFRPLNPREEEELIAQVAEAKPDIFWIGISTPKQLYFMDQMREKLDCKIICPVGYAFDVNAEAEQDAPDWAKYSGFQWLHRAIKQPRLWKRYLPDNPRFVWEVFLQILHLKRFPMLLHERIVKPELDAEGYPRFPAGVVSLSAMSLDGARDRVLSWIKTGQKHYVNICTADTMVQCFDRPDMAKIVKNAGMATTDGMPLVWLAHHYGFKEATRVYGPDLMLALCEATAALNQRSEVKGQRSDQNSSDLRPPASDFCCQTSESCYHYPSQEETGSLDLSGLTSDLRSPISEKKCVTHFFYGATDEVLEQLKVNLMEKFPGLQIAGMYAPPFRPLTCSEQDQVAEMINASGADIVWCGLGTPKQDYWVAEFRPRLHCAAILAVGAAFNFHAGHVKQAPRWMMKSGLEWVFRLCSEPKRLWRRYIIGNPRFLMLTWRQFLSRETGI